MSDTLTWNLIVRNRSEAALREFERGLGRIGKTVRDNSKDTDKLAHSTEKLAGGMIRTSGKITTAAFALTHLAGSAQHVVAAVGAASGVLGLLPAVAAQGGIAMATLKIATAGVGDAMKETDPKKLAEDLKKLSPEAQKTVKAFHSLDGVFHSIKTTVQDSFFKGIDSQIKPLGARLPMLSSGLKFVGHELGGIASDFLKFADSKQVFVQLNDIIFGTGHGIVGIRAALKPLYPALLDIVHASSLSLNAMGGGLEKLTTKFSGFITAVTDNGKGGSFATWIQTGLTSVKQLGSSLKSVAGIISGVFGAASGTGGSGLDVLASTLAEINKQVNTPAFQGGLAAVFQAIGGASAQLSAQLPAVASALVGLVPALTSIISASGTGFTAFLSMAIGLAVQLTPAITAVAAALNYMAPVLGPIAGGLYVASKAMLAVNLAMDANPISLVVLGLAALAIGFTLAYQKSETFRAIVLPVFKSFADVALSAIQVVIKVFETLFGVLGHLPGKAGAAFRSLHDAAATAGGGISALKSNINGLKSKKVTITIRTRNETTNYINTVRSQSAARSAATGKATGGPLQAGQLSWVGEHGPELIQTATSAYVHTASESARSGLSAVGGGRSSSSTGTIDGATYNFYITRPLGTPAEIAKAVIEAFQSRAAGSRKFPKSAIEAGLDRARAKQRAMKRIGR
jgi:hypothetical protein